MRLMEFNVAVRQDPTEERTKGGLYVPETVKDREKHSAVMGTIVALSPMAFNADIWPEREPKPRPGDRVVFAKHAGMFLDHQGEELRVMKDKDIVAVIDG